MSDLHKLEIIRLLDHFFDKDKQKAIRWLSCPSLEFGGHAPVHLIKSGKEKIVLDYIRKAVFEYDWPDFDDIYDIEKVH